MVKSLVPLLIFGLLAVHAANALKCYTCDDCGDKEGESKECTETPETTTTPKTTTTPATVQSTTPITTTEKDENKFLLAKSPDSRVETTVKPKSYYCFYVKTDDKVFRGCSKKTTCTDLAEDKYNKMTECYICNDEDNCNSGAASIKSWAFVSIVLIALTRVFFN